MAFGCPHQCFLVLQPAVCIFHLSLVCMSTHTEHRKRQAIKTSQDVFAGGLSPSPSSSVVMAPITLPMNLQHSSVFSNKSVNPAPQSVPDI
ncbi:hypothetical protein N656DRAFT_781064 [Canariomyces notabilis]|uniref:Uncharacterized protein n=1 Tax=Canariomyces notabilis TaxID=2074819 RepID=A0AAN6YPR5_9PEZI|nr:hypothetical protein N656DRAFT_781064 [Canariomyces arenarius]